MLEELMHRWALSLDSASLGNDGTCSYVTAVRTADGSSAVLKIGMPHLEAEHEIHGLRFWNGNPTVRLLTADENLNAMLLERCEPGTTLRTLPEPEQDEVIAGLLRRLWRTPPNPHPFRPISALTEYWSTHTLAQVDRWPEPELVREGLRLFADLPRTAPANVLLATDLHAGNVLRAQREPWLVIDPKPFIGDPAYDATQHLFNCEARMQREPHDTIRRLADLLEVDSERVKLWMFARLAAEPRDDWGNDSWVMKTARALAP
jgi:streptomycin 6-kinase